MSLVSVYRAESKDPNARRFDQFAQLPGHFASYLVHQIESLAPDTQKRCYGFLGSGSVNVRKVVAENLLDGFPKLTVVSREQRSLANVIEDARIILPKEYEVRKKLAYFSSPPAGYTPFIAKIALHDRTDESSGKSGESFVDWCLHNALVRVDGKMNIAPYALDFNVHVTLDSAIADVTLSVMWYELPAGQKVMPDSQRGLLDLKESSLRFKSFI